MKQHVRAEDFAIEAGFINLGGRQVAADSILFAHVERRVSLEAIGCALALVGSSALILSGHISSAWLIMGLLLIAFSLGLIRELRRAYVLVFEIYQRGIFEVRGFTLQEAQHVEDALAALRSEHPKTGVGKRSSFLTGNMN